jgi:phospholipid/cholesterol/gamma-HCH transport system permease protein
MAKPSALTIESTARGVMLRGALTVLAGESAREALRSVQGRGHAITVDGSTLTALDTVGALWLVELQRRLEGEGKTVEWAGFGKPQLALLARVAEVMQPEKGKREAGVKVEHKALVKVGRATVALGKGLMQLFSLLGEVVTGLSEVAVGRRAFRWNALVRHMHEAGLNAVPIVMLISFLMSIVLAYQGVAQLKMFGAQQYAINLVAVSVLREMGGLLAAIMVAGRSGSSFTSEIGVMKIREEVDALTVMGMTPLDVMILPRIVALIVVLPLLTFAAFVAGLLGGALVSVASLGVGFTTYLHLFAGAVSSWTAWIGIIKAPVFALFIGLISCLAGMRVSGSAESVGRETTSAVVQGIFAVLVLDAAFSVLFTKIGW